MKKTLSEEFRKEIIEEVWEELNNKRIERVFKSTEEQRIICWFVNLPIEKKKEIYYKNE